MALNIKDRRTDELARRAAELRQTGITEAVRAALERDVVELEKAREADTERRMEAIREIQRRVALAPVLDPRSTREIQNELNDDILDSHR